MVLGRDNAPGYDSNAPIGRKAKATAYRSALVNQTVFYNTGNAVGSGMINPYSTGGRRITDGLLSIWWFTEGTGTVIKDREGGSKKTDLNILSGTSWTQDASLGNRYFLNLSAGGHVQASTDELYNAMQAKVTAGIINEFSIEAWVKPTNLTQNGPARIITLAEDDNGSTASNFMVGQGWWGANPSTVYNTRVRETPSSIDADGTDYQTPTGTATTNLQHLVLTVSGEPAGIASKLYVDGIEQIDEIKNYYGGATQDTATNFLVNWSPSYNLDIGNTVITGGDRQWKGGIYLMSMYTRALLPGEVKTNYDAGVTTDSVLPLPSCKFDSPLSSTVYAEGSAVSIPFSIGGIRAASLSATYSVSSSDLSSSEYTIDKDLTLGVGPNELGNTVSITPKLTCSGDGIITAHLNSMSVGSPVAGDTSTYSLYVSSMDVNTTVSGIGDRTTDTTLAGQTLPIASILSRKHRYDISATIDLSAHAGNTGTYALVTSTMIVPSGIAAYSPYLLSAGSGLFFSGDSVRLSSTGASSDSSLATITASMNDVITFSNTPAGDKPGPGNTGYGVPYADLQAPDESIHTWWDESQSLVTQSNIIIRNIKFEGKTCNLSKTASGFRADNVSFVDCLFDGLDIEGGDYLLKCNYANKARNISFLRCEFTGTACKEGVGDDDCTLPLPLGQGVHCWQYLVNSYVGYCKFWDLAQHITSSWDWEHGCIFENNYYTQTGKKKCAHADALQSQSHTNRTAQDLCTIRNNYFDMRIGYFDDGTGTGTTVNNPYAPKIKITDPPCNPYEDNYQCHIPIRIVAEKGSGNVEGSVHIHNNWFQGWTNCYNFGAKEGRTSILSATIENNRYGRDFQTSILTTNNKYGGWSGTINWKDNWDTEVWDDNEVSIKYSHPDYKGNIKEFTRYLCEQYGNCPDGTWDDNWVQTCYCKGVVVDC